jgi:hypothetical protein
MSFLTQIDPDKYPQTPFAPFSLEPGFSLSNASAMAWMSQLTYEATDLLDPNARVAAIAAKLGLQASVFAHSFSSKLAMTSARGVIAVGRTRSSWRSPGPSHSLSSTGFRISRPD